MSPTYNYICDECELISTRYMTFEEYDLSINKKIKCEKCKNPIRRVLVSSPKITFKGRGFYSNDSKGNQNENSGD